MKRIAGLLALLFIMCTASTQRAHAQDVMVSYQAFYDELSPYGQWVFDPEYGNVWVPNEEPGYRPYATRGHWVMTEYGNMWVSDAPWGWACYHYGRWTYNPYYGWVWIPGHEWAPAWVSWRSGGGYYGWAPMGPGYVIGGSYDYPDNYWVFVTPQYLYHPNVYTYYDSRYSVTYIHQTTYINETYVDNSRHTTYYYGPRQQEIERVTRQPVQIYHVSEARSAGAGGVRENTVNIYRPSINASTANTARPTSVIKASQPVGRPQAITPEHATATPAFRQVMQQQNPTFKSPNVYNGSAKGNTGTTLKEEPQNQQRPASQHAMNPQENRQPAMNNNEPARNTTQQEGANQQRYQQPQNNQQPQRYERPGSGQQEQNNQRPNGGQQNWGGNGGQNIQRTPQQPANNRQPGQPQKPAAPQHPAPKNEPIRGR